MDNWSGEVAWLEVKASTALLWRKMLRLSVAEKSNPRPASTMGSVSQLVELDRLDITTPSPRKAKGLMEVEAPKPAFSTKAHSQA